MSSTTKTIEKNIYAEERSGSVRFIVAVSPFPKDSSTWSLEERARGLQWARRRRLELLDQKHAVNSAPPSKTIEVPSSAQQSLVSTRTHPEHTKLRDVIATYKHLKLKNLRGAASELSRLKRLDEWLGDYTLGELGVGRIEAWMDARLSGALGSGRNPNRKPITLQEGKVSNGVGKAVEVPAEQQNNKTRKKRKFFLEPNAALGSIPQRQPGADASIPVVELTKQQKHYAKNREGLSFPTAEVFPVSTQTVRHELVLLRRALKSFFDVRGMMLEFGLWLNNHKLMTMPLPDKADSRRRRISDYEVSLILKHLPEQVRPIVLFAVLSGLRRTELLSLRWENLNLNNHTIFLDKPGHSSTKKTKVVARDVPLLPSAVELLKSLGIKANGLIFDMCPGSLSQIFRRAADRAGLYDIVLHDARREALTRLVELWHLSLEVVVKFSGHKELSTLQKHYIELSAAKVAQDLAAIPKNEQPRMPGTVE
jgi:integrase